MSSLATSTTTSATASTAVPSKTPSTLSDLSVTDTRSASAESGLGTNPERSSIKIAVVGKGGSGKTTASGILARALARKGLSVVALDCDTNPNLGISLGVGDDETERLAAIRQALDDEGTGHAPSWDELINRFGSDAPDGVRLAVVSRIENPEPG